MAQRAAPYAIHTASHSGPAIDESNSSAVVAMLYSQFAIVQKDCLLGFAAKKRRTLKLQLGKCKRRALMTVVSVGLRQRQEF